MNPWFQRRVVLPTALAVTGQIGMYPELSLLREIERDPDRLDELSHRRLTRLLDKARSVPFYADSLRAGTSAEEDPSACLGRLPFVTKATLQTRLEDLKAPGADRGTQKTTGGSTGEPVTVIKSRRGVARERAASWLGYGWFGVTAGDRAVRFWGQPRTHQRRFRSSMADLAMNRRLFSAFAFRESDLRRYWDVCVRFRPKYLYGYASMLEEFARYLLQEGLPGPSLELAVVISTSEPLTDPRRAVIMEAFGAPVQNEYGCGEVGPIAYECPEEGRLHIMSQNVLVEVLDAEGERVAPGQSGEIVVSDLNNHAMPLLRYAIGDFATVAASCPCGRAFPTLSAVWGRAYDFLEDASGRRYHGEAVMYIFEDLRDRGVNVGRFQVLQDRPGRITVRVVPPSDDGRAQEGAAAIRELCVQRLGGMNTQIEWVDEIERAPSGKTHIIRRLDRPQPEPSEGRERKIGED